MQYEFTEEERSIQQAAARFSEDLANRQEWDPHAPGGFDESDFREMGELGFFALAIPESLGGLGLGYPAQGLVLECAGYSLVQGPVLDHCIALSLLESGLGYESQIPELVTGEKRATTVFGWRGDGKPSLSIRGKREASGFEVSGYVDVAHRIVTLAAGSDGGLQLAVAGSEEVAAHPVHDEDYSWRGSGVTRVQLTEENSWMSAPESDAMSMLSKACSLGAAHSLGCAQRLLDETVAYVRERRQFGRPIGSFQAIKHRVADLYIEIEHTRSLVYAALGHTPGDPLLGFMAKRSAASTLSLASRAALQCHGGIGFTWESTLHRYVRAGLRLNGWPLDGATIDDLIYRLAVDGETAEAARGSRS